MRGKKVLNAVKNFVSVYLLKADLKKTVALNKK
jgi:hypothetical protein